MSTANIPSNKDSKPELTEASAKSQIAGSESAETKETIKIVDSKGRSKEIPRADFERKKRRRKKHERHTFAQGRSIFSVAFILLVMIFATYIALKLVK